MSKKLLRSTFLFGIMTSVSRVLGFVRDIVFGYFFGASSSFDAFLLAFRIPNLFRRLVAEGAFAQAFVPTLSEYKVKESKDAVFDFLAAVTGALASFLVVLTVLGILFSPFIISLFAPGFSEDGGRHELATLMLRITFPYLFLVSIVALLSAVLNCYGSFAAPAFAPVFLNIALIFAAFYLVPLNDMGVTALAWGVVLGGILQLIFIVPFLYKKNLLFIPRLNWSHPGVKQVMLLMAPALLGVGVHQINILVNTIFASFLETGSISWLYYSDRLMELPLGVFGVAIATVVLPSLSKQHTRKTTKEFSNTLDWALRLVLLCGLPSMIGLYFLAGPIISTLFHHGEFTKLDVFNAGLSLEAYAVGLLSLMLVKVLASAYYSRKDIKTPVKIAIYTMIFNLVLCGALIGPLAHAGLALASSIAALFNAIWLFSNLYKNKVYSPQSGWGWLLIQLTMACTILLVVILSLCPELEVWHTFSRGMRVYKLAEIISLSSIAYFATLFVTGLRTRHLLANVAS